MSRMDSDPFRIFGFRKGAANQPRPFCFRRETLVQFGTVEARVLVSAARPSKLPVYEEREARNWDASLTMSSGRSR
jgi:hypothetical protein